MAESADVLSAAASAGDPAGPGRRLLDGRHGRARPARDVLERARSRWASVGAPRGQPASCRSPTSIPPPSIKAFCGEHGGVVCTSSNAAATLKWALGARRAGAVPARSAPGPQHGLQAWACRSTRWSSGIRTRSGAASIRDAVDARADDPVEGPLLRAHALHRPADRDTCARSIRASASSSIPRCRGTSCRRPTTAGSTEYIIKTVKDEPAGSVWAVGTEIHLVNRLAHAGRARPDGRCRSISSAASARRCSACRPTTCSGCSKGSWTARSTTASSCRTIRSTGRGSRSIACCRSRNLALTASGREYDPPVCPIDKEDVRWLIHFPRSRIRPMRSNRTSTSRRWRFITGSITQAYVTNLNAALEKHPELQSKSVEDLLQGHRQRARGHPHRGAQQRRRPLRTTRCSGRSWRPKAGGAPTGAIADAINVVVRQLRQVQGSSSRRPAAGRFGSGWAWVIDSGGKLAIESTREPGQPADGRQEAASSASTSGSTPTT